MKRGTRRNARRGARRSAARRLSLGKKVLFALVPLVGLFALIELGLLIAGVQPARFVSDPYVGFESSFPLFIQVKDEQAVSVFRTAPQKTKYLNEQSFPAEKDADTCRIFCVGGSTTHGFPYGDTTSYPGWLRGLLPAADPQRNWEVINCGAMAYASYRVAKLMEELVQYEPDLFIIYAAHNEFVEQRTYSEIIERPAALKWADVQLTRLRTYSLMKSIVGFLRGEHTAGNSGRELLGEEVDAKLDKSAGLELYERDDELTARVYKHYAFNLARMVQIARSAGAKVLFIRPARNVLDCPPFKSQHRQGLTPAELARWQAHYQAGIVAAARQAYPRAVTEFAAAARIDDRYAALHYEIGRTYFAQGRHEQARAALERAIDEDVCPVRAQGRIDAILRKVAAEHSVDVIDFAGLLEQRSRRELGYPLLGAAYFVDHVHTTIPIRRMLAESILDYLIEQGIATPAPDWGPAKAEAVAATVYDSIDEDAHAIARQKLAKALAYVVNLGQAERMTEHAVLLHSRGEYDLAESRYREALVIYRERLGDDHPAVTTALRNIARVLGAKGAFAAAEPVFAEVVQRQRKRLGDDDPALTGSLADLARILCAQGKFAQAEPLFVDVLARQRKRLGDEHPDVLNTRRELAMLWQQMPARGTKRTDTP